MRDLNFTKNAVNLFGLRLKSRHLFLPRVFWFRCRWKLFNSYFAQENELVYCTNIEGLLETFEISYDPAQWRTFILVDSSKRSLKAVLFHSGAVIPVGHSLLRFRWTWYSMARVDCFCRDHKVIVRQLQKPLLQTNRQRCVERFSSFRLPNKTKSTFSTYSARLLSKKFRRSEWRVK